MVDNLNFKLSKLAKRVNWKKLLTGIAIWAVTEIVLSYVGLDDFADYSEFLLERHLPPVVSICYIQ